MVALEAAQSIVQCCRVEGQGKLGDREGGDLTTKAYSENKAQRKCQIVGVARSGADPEVQESPQGMGQPPCVVTVKEGLRFCPLQHLESSFQSRISTAKQTSSKENHKGSKLSGHPLHGCP